MEDERLIELVREKCELFDMSHRKYVDNVWKSCVWTEIGKQLGQDSKKCKSRWESLRGQYRKYIRNLNTEAGQQANTKFKFSDEMSFLRPHIKNKMRDTSVFNENESPEVDPDDVGHTQLNVSTPVECLVEPVDSSYIEVPPRSPSLSSMTSWVRSRPTKREYEETSLSVLMKHVLEMEKHSKKIKSDDEISHFFSSMEASFRKFSYLDQIQAKQQIFNVITGIEMKKCKLASNDRLQQKTSIKTVISDGMDSETNSDGSHLSTFSPDL